MLVMDFALIKTPTASLWKGSRSVTLPNGSQPQQSAEPTIFFRGTKHLNTLLAVAYAVVKVWERADSVSMNFLCLRMNRNMTLSQFI